MNTVITLFCLWVGTTALAQVSPRYRHVLFVPTGDDGASEQSPGSSTPPQEAPVTYPDYTPEEMALSKKQYQAAFAAMASKMAAHHGLHSAPQQNALVYRPPLRGLYHRKIAAQVHVEPQPMVLPVFPKRRQVTPLPPQTHPVHLYQPPTLQKVYNYENAAPRARPIQVLHRPAFARVQNVYGRIPQPVQVYHRPSLQQVQYNYEDENPEQAVEPQQPRQELLVVLPNGFLADTQEVQAAKKAHLAEVTRMREAAARAAAEAQTRPTPIEYITPAVQYADEDGRQYYTVQQPATRYVKYVPSQ